MAHWVLCLMGGDREGAIALLDAGMWGIDLREQHRDAVAPDDLALIYLAAPHDAFIGAARIASPIHGWDDVGAGVYPGTSPSGVLLSDIRVWEHPVTMASAVERIDPTASNPLVQENARTGFRSAVVRITGDEYGAVLDLGTE
jgi:hypothetical protein